MKFAIYLTRSKIFYSDKILDWDGVSLVEIFKNFKDEMGIKNFRIILGNDLSNVTFFQTDELDRNKIGAEMQTWIPYNLDNECFDYRTGVFNGSSVVQVVAVEKWLLEIISLAVTENSLNLELMLPVGSLLAEKTSGKNNLTQIKWNGYENLSILAINGFAHSVFEFETDEKILNFAKTKWGAETEIEQINLSANNYDLTAEAFNEQVRGKDENVLNIPLLKKQVFVDKNEIGSVESNPTKDVDLTKKKVSKTTIALIILLMCSLAVFGLSIWFRGKKAVVVEMGMQPGPAIPVATQAAVVTQEIDFSKYKVNVLNASEVTGEALRIKKSLSESGFLNVDVGNAPKQTETEIKKKDSIGSAVVTKAKSSFGEYKVGSIGTLTEDDKYDLVIVLGKDKVEQ